MTAYQYPEAKVIDELVFKKTPNGSVRAYLHAKAEADLPAIRSALDKLKGQNYECIPFVIEGKHYLEVRGFKNEETLVQSLNETDLVSGKRQEIEKEQEIITWRDWFDKRSLQFSGCGYLFGDAGLFWHAIKEKDAQMFSGATFYCLGTLALLFYGRNDQSTIQVHDHAKELEKYLADERIKIPEGTAMHSIAQDKHKSLLQKANEFGKRYPSEIFNFVTAIAGVSIAVSAVRHKLWNPKASAAERSIGWTDLGLGSMTATGGAFGVLVKEKKRDPDTPRETGLAGLWERMREHPLTVTGILYGLSTASHAKSTYQAWGEYKKGKAAWDSVIGRAMFVLAGIVGEGFLAISSKGHGEGVVSDKSVDTSVIALAAELIARQPEGEQEKMIEQVGKFLGDQKILAMKDAQVVDMLREQIEAQRTNPWVLASALANGEIQEVASPSAGQSVPPAEPAAIVPAAEKLPPWQSRHAAREAAETHSQLAV